MPPDASSPLFEASIEKFDEKAAGADATLAEIVALERRLFTKQLAWASDTCVRGWAFIWGEAGESMVLERPFTNTAGPHWGGGGRGRGWPRLYMWR